MQSEPNTLYKLMILYMLKAVRFPFPYTMLSDFFLLNEFCTYFALEQAIQELLESHLMKEESLSGHARYEITRAGEDALGFFGKDISPEIVQDMNAFLEEHRVRLRNEMGIISDYQETSEGEYAVSFEVREGTGTLMKLQLTVPSEDQASIMCRNWKDTSQTIYASIMKELLKG